MNLTAKHEQAIFEVIDARTRKCPEKVTESLCELTKKPVTSIPTTRDLVKAALNYWPEHKEMRRQLVQKSLWLYQNGKHAFLTGGFQR